MLKKLLIGTFAFVALTLAVTVSAAYDFGTTTLKVGSTGQAVANVQTVVGATPVDGVFGNITKAKVMAWQASHGLTADGLVGANTKAAMNAAPGTPVTGLPAGCTSTVGYSATTGIKCDNTTTTPTTGNNGPLTGGAGDVNLSTLSTDVEDTVKENSSEKVLGFKVEADGSDIAVTSVKLVMANIDADSSERLTDYIDEVKVFMGSTEVGSADASDFSRDAGTPDVFSQTISLTNATVREGDENKFYVEVSTGSIDSEDITNAAEFAITLDAVRFQDATGAILSESNLDENDYASYSTADSTYDNTFDFSGASEDDSLEIKSSSSDPDATTVKVAENDASDETLVGAFKFDVDEDSTDITLNEMELNVTVAVNAVDLDSIEDIINTLRVEIDGNDFDADVHTDLTTATGTAVYLVEFDSDEMVIEAGDTVDVKIYAEFNEQELNYTDGTTISILVNADNDIDAEGEEDDLAIGDKDGTFTSETHTLSLTGGSVNVTNITESGNSNDADDSYEEGTFTFYVTIEAEDGDVDVDATSIVETLLDPATNTVALDLQIVNLDGDATETTPGTDYTVEDGESNTFSIVYTINPDAAGTYYVRLDSIDGISIDKTTEGVNLVAA